MSFSTYKTKAGQKSKKKPPPRPPPPNFSKFKSKSSFNLNRQIENLIEWSPPNSPTVERTHNFGGSVSSSFSSSTSSLASSKKSFECDLPVTNNLWPVNFNNFNQTSHMKLNNSPPTDVPSYQGISRGQQNSVPVINISLSKQVHTSKQNSAPKVSVSPIFGPTIIRAQANKNKMLREHSQDCSDPPSPTLPMPCIPPPSPPRDASQVDVPYGIALYDYQETDPNDLSFKVNDIVILLRRVNDDWFYGRVLEREGMFPANFIEVQVPLTEDKNTVMALYEFRPQMIGDLQLKPGQFVKVLRKINNDWLYGESNGQTGQFPSNFVDRLPS